MHKNLLVLIPSKEIEKSANKAAALHFRESGDESVYMLPHIIILGATERNRFDRRSFSLDLIFSSEMVRTRFGFVLPPLSMKELNNLQREYGLEECETGLWFSSKSGWNVEIENSTRQRLAMLKWTGEGYTLLQ